MSKPHYAAANDPAGPSTRSTGGAHAGSHHWLAQRLSALALIPALLWLVLGLATNDWHDPWQARAWFSTPGGALASFTVLSVGYYHGVLGLREVIADYVHTPHTKTLLLAGIWLVGGALALLGLWGWLPLALGMFW